MHVPDYSFNNPQSVSIHRCFWSSVFRVFGQNSDIAVRFGDPGFLYGTDIWRSMRIYCVILTFDPLTLNTCSISTVTGSHSIPNFSDIEQSAAEL